MYSWGCNDQKALGRSGEETEPGPVEGLDDVFIVHASCGDSISVALSQDGLYLTFYIVFMHGEQLEDRMGSLDFSLELRCKLLLF